MDLPNEITQLLTIVSAEERRMLMSRFGLDRGFPRTFDEASCNLGVGLSEAMAIEDSALAKLRNRPGSQL